MKSTSICEHQCTLAVVEGTLRTQRLEVIGNENILKDSWSVHAISNWLFRLGNALVFFSKKKFLMTSNTQFEEEKAVHIF